MAEDWPSGVPQCYFLDGYLEEKQPVTIRSPVDSGPQKIRRRFTRAIVGFLTGIAVTKEQYDLFWLWFDVTLQGGVLSYNMLHPITGETVEARFLQPPRVGLIDTNNYRLEFVLEVI